MGHHLFTKLLLPMLLRTAATSADTVRIVNLSSELHSIAPKGGIQSGNINQPESSMMFGVSSPLVVRACRRGGVQYGHANLMPTKALAKRHGRPNSNLIVAAVHSGIVHT